MRGLILLCGLLVCGLSGPRRAGAADVIPARPSLTLARAIDLPWIDRAVVVYLWRSDRPLELRWSTGDVELAPAGTRLRIVPLSDSLSVGNGWSELGVSAHEPTDGSRVAGWGWAWLSAPFGLMGG